MSPHMPLPKNDCCDEPFSSEKSLSDEISLVYSSVSYLGCLNMTLQELELAWIFPGPMPVCTGGISDPNANWNATLVKWTSYDASINTGSVGSSSSNSQYYDNHTELNEIDGKYNDNKNNYESQNNAGSSESNSSNSSVSSKINSINNTNNDSGKYSVDNSTNNSESKSTNNSGSKSTKNSESNSTNNYANVTHQDTQNNDKTNSDKTSETNSVMTSETNSTSNSEIQSTNNSVNDTHNNSKTNTGNNTDINTGNNTDINTENDTEINTENNTKDKESFNNYDSIKSDQDEEGNENYDSVFGDEDTTTANVFNISNCEDYSNVWLWDLAFTCKDLQTFEGCECKLAKQLFDAGKIECARSNDVSSNACPAACSVCQTCMTLLGCEDIYENIRTNPPSAFTGIVPATVSVGAVMGALVLMLLLIHRRKSADDYGSLDEDFALHCEKASPGSFAYALEDREPQSTVIYEYRTIHVL